MTDQILIVDDDANILSAIKRQLRKTFTLDTAEGPEAGLQRLRSEASYAVVLSDMQMPGMNGVEFLQEARRLSPNSIRLMLTGNADQQTATSAINNGAVFRFLTKPCSTDDMTRALHDALNQYRLETAEKQLLEETLTGSIGVLSDILAMTNPAAFGRATTIQDYVRRICEHLPVERQWELEIAAMLSQLGCVTVPEDVLERAGSKSALSDSDQEMLSRHPQIAGQLLRRIPRMDGAAQLIESQTAMVGEPSESVAVETRILQAAMMLESTIRSGSGAAAALTELSSGYDVWGEPLVDACTMVIQSLPSAAVEVGFDELRCGMVLAEPLRTKTEQILVAAGQEITDTVMTRVRNFAGNAEIHEPICVFPAS